MAISMGLSVVAINFLKDFQCVAAQHLSPVPPAAFCVKIAQVTARPCFFKEVLVLAGQLDGASILGNGPPAVALALQEPG